MFDRVTGPGGIKKSRHGFSLHSFPIIDQHAVSLYINVHSKLGEYTYHCHLNYSWVAVWRCEGERIILEINKKTETIPRIHNLLKLYGTVRNYLSLNINIVHLEQINETYIDSRYPSDLGLLPEGNLSHEKAILFYQEAKNIYSQIRNRLND